MEAAGLVEKVEIPRPLRFHFEDIRKLPPPIIAFTDVAFSYSGKKEDFLYEKLSFGIECVFIHLRFDHYAASNLIYLNLAWTLVLPSLVQTVPENPLS